MKKNDTPRTIRLNAKGMMMMIMIIIIIEILLHIVILIITILLFLSKIKFENKILNILLKKLL